MLFRIGIENNVEGRSIAWALNHPGCFAYGATDDQARQNLPAAIQAYIDWIAEREPQPWVTPGTFEIQVEETWEVFAIDEDYELVEEGYEVNAWFRHDWKPLAEEEIQHGLKILQWSREDLLAAVEGLKPEDFERKMPGERWDIAGILKHVGGAEWWYLDRLDLAFPREEVPQEPFARLERTRDHLLKTLPELAGEVRVRGVDGEFWSPRKVLRRALWHERDHTEHIRSILIR